MPEYPLDLTLSKVLKGQPKGVAPFVAGFYVMDTEDVVDCFFTNASVPGHDKVDGMETSVELQKSDSTTERTWIAGKGGWVNEDENEVEWEFAWKQLIIKETNVDGEWTNARAWFALGEEGDSEVATENWTG